jgi:hypothetical protein
LERTRRRLAGHRRHPRKRAVFHQTDIARPVSRKRLAAKPEKIARAEIYVIITLVYARTGALAAPRENRYLQRLRWIFQREKHYPAKV